MAGQKFAMNEEKVILAAILRNFTLKSTQSTADMEPRADIIMRPGRGVMVEVYQRPR